jgi:hypothetical protein
MRLHRYSLFAATVVVAAAVTTAMALGATGGTNNAHMAKKAKQLQIALTPSSAQLAACMPGAQLHVKVALTTEERGHDTFDIAARDLPPDREFTIFLLQQAGSPFGAAEYIGDLSTDASGNGHAKLRLIVEEAFSSTLVNGSRQRVDLNRIGVWFADPLADDFCVGVNSAVTPFDGDNAGAFRSSTRPTPTRFPLPDRPRPCGARRCGNTPRNTSENGARFVLAMVRFQSADQCRRSPLSRVDQFAQVLLREATAIVRPLIDAEAPHNC